MSFQPSRGPDKKPVAHMSNDNSHKQCKKPALAEPQKGAQGGALPGFVSEAASAPLSAPALAFDAMRREFPKAPGRSEGALRCPRDRGFPTPTAQAFVPHEQDPGCLVTI